MEILLAFDKVPLLVSLCFIACDIVTGIAKAFANNEVSSQVMRRGLWHKFANIMLLSFAAACDIAVRVWSELPDELSTVYVGIAVYICIMEGVSILENLCEINPELSKLDQFNRFGFKKGGDDTQ